MGGGLGWWLSAAFVVGDGGIPSRFVPSPLTAHPRTHARAEADTTALTLRHPCPHLQVTDVNSRDVMELLLITQYFDTLKDSGMSGRSKCGGVGGRCSLACPHARAPPLPAPPYSQHSPAPLPASRPAG